MLAAPGEDDELLEDYSPPVIAEATSSLEADVCRAKRVMQLDFDPGGSGRISGMLDMVA